MIVNVSLGPKKPLDVEPRPFGEVVVRKLLVTTAVPPDGVYVTPFTVVMSPTESESKFWPERVAHNWRPVC